MNYDNYSFYFDFDLDNMPATSCLNGIYDPYNGFEDPDNIMSGLISSKFGPMFPSEPAAFNT